MKFQSLHRSPKDANVIFRNGDSVDVPAQIVGIFVHTPGIVDAQTRRQAVLVVQRHVPLDSHDARYDSYREYDFNVAGRLYYEKFYDIEVIRPSQLVTHFAKTRFGRKFHTNISEASVHVLPLYKVIGSA